MRGADSGRRAFMAFPLARRQAPCDSIMNRHTYQRVLAIPATPWYVGVAVDPAGRFVTKIEFLTQWVPVQEGAPTVTPFLNEIEAQIRHYFAVPQSGFSIPIVPPATSFQQRLRQVLQTIPCGQTRSYSEVAQELASSARAVGQACRCNPVPIIVPCHRITARGALGGFAGQTHGTLASIKMWLLEHERHGR